MSANVYIDHVAGEKVVAKATPQTQAIPGREAEQAKNNAGGFSFVLDMWGVLDRFIMLGTEGGGYYVGEKDLTKQSFATVRQCIAKDGQRAVARAVEYSVSGRAPKNDPALVVLSLAAVHGDAATVAAAYEALPKVARTGTHLFTFVAMLNAMGKWNAAAKRGVAKWYTARSVDRLAVQMLKYQSRNGWSHRDVLRLAHVKPQNDLQNALFKYAVKGADGLAQGMAVPQLLVDFEYLKHATSAKEVVRLVEGNKDISWEMVPTQFLKDLDVISAMLPQMGLTALIRQLGRMTAAGAMDPLSENAKVAIAKLSDTDSLKAQRIHPVLLLQALKQYSAGRGERGSLVWTPNQRVVDALDDAFYESFQYADGFDCAQVLGIDTSGSMTWESSKVLGSPNLLAADVAACFALGVAKRSSNYFIGSFSTEMVEAKISPKMRLDAALRTLATTYGGGTDCSQPMVFAAKRKMNVDLFTVITDNETWAGRHGHPSQVLVKYRKEFNPLAKLAVMATSVSEFTIADPKDAGMMDIAGFDSAVPQILADFVKLGKA